MVALLRFSPSFPAVPVVLASCSVAVAAAPLGAATVEAKRSFDLPRGDAATTLRQFAAAAGRSLVFVTDKVRGETTNAVRGEFTPRDALERMLAGSALEAAQDAATGALVVSRKRTAEAAPVAPVGQGEFHPDSDPKTTTRPVKNTTLRTRLAAMLALLAPPLSDAQTIPPSDTKAEESVVLSPFLVTTERESGYQATSTLAGTRLNTSVKELGASISIYTKDFLNDIGAANGNDLLIYATNMETAGPGGNFSGAAGDINDTQVTNGSRGSPQTGRARGLAGPTWSRNYFPTSIAMDSYNTSAVTVIRGPSATLFGTGSPGGVMDAALNVPNLRRNSNRVEFRYGNNDAMRGSLDLNRVLVRDRLALRIGALKDWEEYNQRPSFEHKSRLFGAVQAKPFKATTVRGSFETGHSMNSRMLNVLPFNSISPQWYASGRPVYDWRFYDDPALNPDAVTQAGPVGGLPVTIGQGQFFDQIGFIYSSPNAASPSAAFRGRLTGTTGTAANALRNNLFHPLLNRDSAGDSNQQFLNTFNLGELAAGGFPGGIIPAGLKMQGFTDYATFDYRRRMLDATARQWDSFTNFNAALEQLFWRDRVGVELAYNTERYHNRNTTGFLSTGNANHIRIDTTVTLPTGQANPNLGRPYVQFGNGDWGNGLTSRRNLRATAFLRYNFRELSPTWGRWLGRHVLTGLRENNRTDALNYSTRISTFGEIADTISSDPTVFARRPGVIVYLGDSILGGAPLRFNPVQIPPVASGLTAPTTYFRVANGDPAQGQLAIAETTLREVLVSGGATRSVNRAEAFVLQSNWLQNILITTLGWRRDDEYRFNRTFTRNDFTDRTQLAFSDFVFPRNPARLSAGETKSYGGVLNWPRQYVRLPSSVDLSFFYNNSGNFSPSGGRVDPFNNPLPLQRGKTREYGLNLSLFNDRLFLRVTRFNTASQNAGLSAGTTGLVSAYNNFVMQKAQLWSQERNINPDIDRTAEVELLFSTLPANFRQLYNFRITGTPEQRNLSASYTNLPGITDLTDFTATGTEIEVTYSPNSRWRLLANVAQQETVRTNIGPVAKQFFALMMPVWEKLANVPFQNYPQGWVLGTPLPASQRTFAQDLESTAGPLVPFNTARASEGAASPEQRKWRANFVANYTFAKDSFLKGWNVGAGLRWQDRIAIGYPASRDSRGSVVIDVKNPYYDSAETNVDAFVGYTRKIWQDRIEWKVQLNARNMVGTSDPIPVTVQPWGDPAIMRVPPEKRWYLTNTFSF